MVVLLKRWWLRLSKVPMGKWLFSRIIGFFIPYSGSVRPYVDEVRAGYARLSINDCRSKRNHLRSIHALALANVGELTTGLALHFGMAPDDRAILTRLEIDFIKKARGKITVIADFPVRNLEPGLFQVEAKLYDEKKIEVARIKTSWLLGKEKPN
jgi:acyl-coenzyme A thioesterase PaaI-like protein